MTDGRVSNGLAPIEHAALLAIAGLFPYEEPAILAQLATVRVLERHNSTAGFFTVLEVDRSTPAINRAGPLGDVHMHAPPLKHGLHYLVFLDDGYLSLLEAYTADDNTAGLDIFALSFRYEPFDPA